MKYIVLYGGGLDSSAVALYCANSYSPEDVTLLHVDYGQKAMQAERKAMRWFASKYGFKTYEGAMNFGFSGANIMRGTPLGKVAETNRLELRNLVLISYAASYAASIVDVDESVTILLGFHVEPAGASFPDARTDYLAYLEDSINLATKAVIRLETPFQYLTRLQILQEWGAFDPELLTHSHTCYEQVACGQCTHCVEKTSMIKQLEVDCEVRRK